MYCGRLSYAQREPLQTPKAPIIDPHLVEQTTYRRDIKDNGYKSVFTNSRRVHGRNRSSIKGLGKNTQNSQKSELIHWRQCFCPGATEPCPLALKETLERIRVILHNVKPCWQLAKNGMPVKTSAKRLGWKTNCGFKRHPKANWWDFPYMRVCQHACVSRVMLET